MKLSYSGPMFRYEQPQAGRRRQFWQTGVEYLDVTSPWADAEVIEVGYRFLEEIGLDRVTVLLNTLGDHEDRPAYLASLRDWLRGRGPPTSARTRGGVSRPTRCGCSIRKRTPKSSRAHPPLTSSCLRRG